MRVVRSMTSALSSEVPSVQLVRSCFFLFLFLKPKIFYCLYVLMTGTVAISSLSWRNHFHDPAPAACRTTVCIFRVMFSALYGQELRERRRKECVGTSERGALVGTINVWTQNYLPLSPRHSASCICIQSPSRDDGSQLFPLSLAARALCSHVPAGSHLVRCLSISTRITFPLAFWGLPIEFTFSAVLVCMH